MQKIEHDFNYKQNNRCFQDGKETAASQSGTVWAETTKPQVTLCYYTSTFNSISEQDGNDKFFLNAGMTTVGATEIERVQNGNISH